MAGRRRRSDDLDDDFAALIMVGLILIGLFGYMHKLPPRIIIAGHQMLVALSPSLAQSVESAFPKGHADLGDLVPYAGLLLGFAIVLLIVSRPSQRRARLRMRTLGELLTLTPGQFEDAVAELLRAQGYRHVKIVGGPGDLNVDIVARDPKGRRVAVQCKQYGPGNRISAPMIQTFIGMVHVHHKADIGIYVTTSSYTDQALDLARQHGLILLDGNDLGRLLAKPGKRRRFLPRLA